MKQFSGKIIFLSGLLFVLGVNLYFRSFPIYFPQLKSQAKEIVLNTHKQMVAGEVQKRFPQFFPTAKDAILKSQFKEYLQQNKKTINEQVKDLYVKLKDRYQDEKGRTYLMELDCWHWSRYVENVVRFGHPGDETVFGNQWDLYMLAPLGSYLDWQQFLYYFSAFLYKSFSLFKSMELFTFLFYLPLFFSFLFMVVLYVFTFRYSGFIGAVTSCLFIGLAPMFLQRSCAGWFDTDVLNLLLPFLVIWAYVLASCSFSFARKVLWVSISSLFVGVFSFTWTHWWFIFLIILIYEVIYVLREIFLNVFLKRKYFILLKQHLFCLVLFILLSLSWTLIFSGKEPIAIFYNQVKQVFILNKPLSGSIWPNVYSTVGELRAVGIRELGRLAGGVWLFLLSLTCLFILLVRALFGRAYTDFERIPVIIFSVWFVSMILATFSGIRFIVFLLVPLGIALGWVLNDAFKYFCKINNKKALFAVMLVFIGLNIVPVYRGNAAAKTIFPLIDDTWYKLLNMIKEKTSQDTVINSWWDFGNWFKVVARRRVIFDGQSQHTPRSYWMAKALLSDNENEAMGILRMLNNGGDKAFDIINGHIKDPLESVLLLEAVLRLAPDSAKEVLLKFLPEAAALDVIKMLFSHPAGAVFVVDYSMPSKITAVSYLGNWNFPKVYIAKKFDNEEKDKIIGHLKGLGIDDKMMNTFYQEVFLVSTKKLDEWLSQRLLFYSGISNGREENGVVFFDNGFIYNPKEQTIGSSLKQVPRSLFVVNNDNLVEIFNPNPNAQFSILVFQSENKAYKSILLDRELGNSLFVRLYFLNGRGLRHFTPFIDVEDENNNYLRVFYIKW